MKTKKALVILAIASLGLTGIVYGKRALDDYSARSHPDVSYLLSDYRENPQNLNIARLLQNYIRIVRDYEPPTSNDEEFFGVFDMYSLESLLGEEIDRLDEKSAERISRTRNDLLYSSLLKLDWIIDRGDGEEGAPENTYLYLLRDKIHLDFYEANPEIAESNIAQEMFYEYLTKHKDNEDHTKSLSYILRMEGAFDPDPTRTTPTWARPNTQVPRAVLEELSDNAEIGLIGRIERI